MSDTDDFEKHVQAIEAMAKRLSDAASVFREAGLILRGGVGPVSAVPRNQGSSAPNPATTVQTPALPYPCPRCGRKGPKAPAEVAGDEECLQCGNPLPLQPGQPGVVVTNKGVMLLDPSRRAALIKQPAFDENGDPVS